MTNTDRPTLSLALALEDLQEAVENLEACQAALEKTRERRDNILMELAEVGVPISKLARLSGLTRERVSKIASPRRRGV